MPLTDVRIYYGHDFVCSYDVPFLVELSHMQLNATLALNVTSALLPAEADEETNECTGATEIRN